MQSNDTTASPPKHVGSTAELGAFSTTASTAQQKTLTLAHLERTVQMLRDMHPEPIGEWMRSQDRPPENWRLVLPQKLRDEVQGPMFWPDYVAFSPVLDKPVFLPRGLLACDQAPNTEGQRRESAGPQSCATETNP